MARWPSFNRRIRWSFALSKLCNRSPFTLSLPFSLSFCVFNHWYSLSLSLSTEKLNRFWCSYLNTSILSHSYSHWYTTYHIKHIGTLPTYIKHIGTLPTYIKHKGTLPTYIKHIGTLCMFTYQQVHIYIHIVTLPTYSFI